MTAKFTACLITIFAGLPLVACQSATPSSCSGFVANALTPAGTVALIQADRPGAERVIGNDRNGERLKCWGSE